MDKVLIGVIVPILGERYDVFVPSNVELKKVIARIAEGVQVASKGKFTPSGLELIINKDPFALLDPSKTIDDYGICDGAQLMLI